MVARHTIVALASLLLAGTMALAASPPASPGDTGSGMRKAARSEAPADQAATPKAKKSHKSQKHARSHHHSKHAARKTSGSAAS